MHKVKCSICNEYFDCDTIPFIKTSSTRYAHASCTEAKEREDKIKVCNMPCHYCKKLINHSEYIELKKNIFAHKNCHNSYLEEVEQKDKINEYVKNLLKVDKLDVGFWTRLNKIKKENEYTYSGILKALIYFYEIKKNDPKVYKNPVGMLPHIYEESKRYYYSLWMLQQQNVNKNINDFIPQEEIIIIQEPKRKSLKRKLFSFLDKED